MREFEISIKSAPSGANVVVKGDLNQILVEFAMLAAAVSKSSGIPLDLLAELVRHGDELTGLIEKGSIGIDLSAIKQARGEQ